MTRVSIRDLNVKYIREVRQFWKQCRERGARRGRGERELRSGTSESQSPMVSYLRVGRVSRNLAEERTAMQQQWRSPSAQTARPARRHFPNNFRNLSRAILGI